MMVIENEDDKEKDTRGLRTLEDIRNYTIKFAIFNFANSWKNLKISTLANSWKNLLINADPDYDFEGFEATDFYHVLQHAGKKDITLDDVQDWLEENEVDPGYQVLSDEEIVAEVVSTKESSSSDEDDEMPVILPKLSEVSGCMDTATVCRTRQELKCQYSLWKSQNSSRSHNQRTILRWQAVKIRRLLQNSTASGIS